MLSIIRCNRRVDSLGKVLLPMDIREIIGVEKGDNLEKIGRCVEWTHYYKKGDKKMPYMRF